MRTRTSVIISPINNKACPQPERAEAGFTLLELVVVLALLALTLTLVLPGLHGIWQRERERASLREFLITMRQARSIAASQHERVRVFLDLRNGRYRIEGSQRTGAWVPGIRVGDAHLVWEDQGARRGYIAFYGDGSSSGGYLALLPSGGQPQVLDVEIITGRVTLKTKAQ